MKEISEKDNASVDKNQDKPLKAVYEDNENDENREIIKSRTENEINILMQEIIEAAPYLKAQYDSYKSPLSMLYVMCREGVSKEFLLKMFRDNVGLSIIDTDIVHCAVVAVGEEFALGFLGKKDILISDFRSAVSNHSSIMQFSRLPEVQDLNSEKNQVRELYDLHVSFLEREEGMQREYFEDKLNSEKAHFQELMETRERAFSDEKENLEGSYKVQLGIYEKRAEDAFVELKTVKDQNEKIRSDYESLKEKYNDAIRERDKAVDDLKRFERNPNANVDNFAYGYAGSSGMKRKKGFFRAVHGIFSGKKDVENNKELVLSLISNPQFTAQQLDVIKGALDDNFPAAELAKMCDPKIPVANMKMMLGYMKRSRQDGRSNIQDSQNKKEDAENECAK